MHHSVRKAKHFILKYDEEYGYYVDDEFSGNNKAKGDMWNRYRRLHSNAWNTVYRPLRRFLMKNVGRVWDDVYSDICERANNSSKTEKYKIFIVLEGIVNIGDVQITEDGRIIYKTGYSHNQGLSELSGDSLYVHPETKVLSYIKPKKNVSKHNFVKNSPVFDSSGQLVEKAKEQKFDDGAKFILHRKFYKRKISAGVFEDCFDEVWMKEVEYKYMGEQSYAVREFGPNRRWCFILKKVTVIDEWHTAIKYRTAELISTKLMTASKKDIRKYKLNEGE